VRHVESVLADTDLPVLIRGLVAPQVVTLSKEYPDATFIKVDIDRVQELARHYEVTSV